ncbi:hypothetical protein [Afipia felis]|jgi:hypothetical protein|uniref:Uncharacterized protein n=2 Tax=Afipia felis TaxID=1035 RepID=A0A380WBT8_AFIFE|nr:hypothetical protein [Afipia felis]EKS29649.1 hypothetical protein HMPREF9697_02177 [Afipia felis ATCC 53690]SUU78356.1 Uncharacterised protein [Afipia felis]SUU86421.1 Uncharacterised protein [Afipia felis]
MSEKDKVTVFGSALLLIAIISFGLYAMDRARSYGDEGLSDISAQSK